MTDMLRSLDHWTSATNFPRYKNENTHLHWTVRFVFFLVVALVVWIPFSVIAADVYHRRYMLQQSSCYTMNNIVMPKTCYTTNCRGLKQDPITMVNIRTGGGSSTPAPTPPPPPPQPDAGCNPKPYPCADVSITFKVDTNPALCRVLLTNLNAQDLPSMFWNAGTFSCWIYPNQNDGRCGSSNNFGVVLPIEYPDNVHLTALLISVIVLSAFAILVGIGGCIWLKHKNNENRRKYDEMSRIVFSDNDVGAADGILLNQGLLSGEWRVSYVDRGSEVTGNVLYLVLSDQNQNSVSGYGADAEGGFVVRGRYNAEKRMFSWAKIYGERSCSRYFVGLTVVRCFGLLVCCGDTVCIKGMYHNEQTSTTGAFKLTKKITNQDDIDLTAVSASQGFVPENMNVHMGINAEPKAGYPTAPALVPADESFLHPALAHPPAAVFASLSSSSVFIPPSSVFATINPNQAPLVSPMSKVGVM